MSIDPPEWNRFRLRPAVSQDDNPTGRSSRAAPFMRKFKAGYFILQASRRNLLAKTGDVV
jgi:hypothetical protein